MASCAVTSVLVKDPRFQALKEAYKDKHYSDDHLAQALQLCREYHDYSDDWFPVSPAQRGVFTRFMNHYLTTAKLSQTDSELGRDSVYNLYTTLYALYTPEQLDARVNMLARDFRELVDRLEAADRRGRSRQELIKAQGDGKRNGYVTLMEKVFNIYEERYTDVDRMMTNFDKRFPNATPEQKDAARKRAEYRAQEYKTILANRERLSALAATKIGEDEGFVVNITDFQVSFDDFNEEDFLSEGDETNAEETGVDNEEGSKGDRYGDFRTLKLLNTLSVRAKRLLSGIQKVNSNGDIIRDDLGVTQYVGGRQAAVVLKKVLVNSSPETMMSDLAVAAESYPWIRGLIAELRKNPDNQATIYDNFKSAETTYVYVGFENGSYTPHIANSRSAGNAMMREAGNNLSAGYVLDESNSIYTGFGALKSADAISAIHNEFEQIKKLVQSDVGTKWIRMVDGDKQATKAIEDAIQAGREQGLDLEYLRDSPEEAMAAFLNSNPEIATKLANMLRGMGFAVTAKDIRTIATQKMSEKGFGFLAGSRRGGASTRGRNKLYQLVEFMDTVYNRAEEIHKKNLTPTGQYLYNTTRGFRRINSVLALAQYKDVEARVVNEGKSLSTYNNVNLLHQTFDLLKNSDRRSDEQYLADLEDEFLRYEGMALGFGAQRQVHGWLQKFMDNTDDIRENLRVLDIAAFNHVEYPQLNRGQKLTNSLVMFFNASNMMQKDGYAAYEVPIQADYSTAYNFVFAPKMTTDEVLDALTDEVLMECERIDSIQRRINDDSRVKLNVYERQGLKFQIFPALNDNGFIDRYTQITDADDARAFVRSQVAEQMRHVINADMKTITDASILSNPAMKRIHFGYGNYGSLFAEDGQVGSLSEEAQDMLRNYAANVFYAREQMVKLLTGGLEQFNGLIDYEKRNMLTHATRTSLYTKATWKGKLVGKDSQNVAYIGDAESKSAFINDIAEMLQQLLKEKVISKSQYDTMLSAYSKIKTTDGQGLRTLESYRTVMIMADQWDDRHETAYKNIMSGKPTQDDVEIFMQNIKPVLTGYESVPAAAGENQKPVKLTVLHKYSEMVLLPTILADKCLQCKSVPMQALDRAQARLRKQGKEIDMFLFHSGVKVGAHSILQPFALDKDGKRLLPDVKSIEDYIVETVNNNAATIHTLPFKYYGIAASTPAHVADDKIAWASQAEKVAWANISDGDKISIRGDEMNAADARELYNSIKTANIIEAYKELREMFADSDKLEKVFQEELASKSYSSRELQYALAHLKDGTFALPLFSPNVEHQVQELLASIIKKRLTKPRAKGANILQSTGFGMDIEASQFDNNDALTEDEKLHVVFEGAGENKRIKYVEVYLPIHDSRLKIFADENGNIGPERLKELVANGTIPESMLEFIAYRTPSDAEHSVIPCRIKGFISNTAGATIRMPKEIMVMTGHDYDGDKMRCHFKNFRLIDRNGDDIDSTTFMRMVMGQIPVNANMRKVEVYEYDYDKSPLENTQQARDNARVELMFAELTSPAGSRRMIIPGGCDESKVIAKSLYLVRVASDGTAQRKISDQLQKQGMDAENANRAVKSAERLYDILIRKSDEALTDIVRDVSSSEMPYTLTHSADAFDYIMGGAEMIGIYALYNSALQMMQRLDMSYVPAVSRKTGKQLQVSLFGHQLGKLFDITNHRGRLASLGLARLLNAAVDNNKDPVLGYLNQTKEMAEMTFFLFASGITEEEIHLLYNQPAVLELINRLKSRDSQGFDTEVHGLIEELTDNLPFFEKLSKRGLGEWIGVDNVKKMTRDDFTRELSTSFSELRDEDHLPTLEQQVSILQTLAHLGTAASNLAQFVKLTRPESESGAIGTTISDIIAKVIQLNEFRDKISSSDDSDLRISGMRDVMARRDVHEGWDTSYIEEILGTQLPEVVALNSLMIDSSLDMFRPFFPQAKDSWINLAAEIAEEYNYRNVQPGIIERVGSEMILWKLLSNKKFITGDPQEEQRRILIDVPKQVKDLKERIFKAEKEPGKDTVADELIGNAFLQNLSSTSPENSSDVPRLQFRLNGPAVEGTADSIRAHWGALLTSPDEKVRQLGIDLFKYNLYSNGFSYGMYEFAHFAPFSILLSTPNYIDALQGILRSNWNDDGDRENFINQYYMNHWGDRKFLPKINIASLALVKLPEGTTGQLWLAKQGNDEIMLNRIQSKRYVVVTSGERGESQTLYRVEPGNADAGIVLVKAVKLGVRNRNQQMTLQYNPTIDYRFVKPVVAGNESAWGQLDELNVFAAGNINASGMMPIDSGYMTFLQNSPFGLGFFGLQPVAQQLQQVEKKAELAAQKNEGKLEDAKHSKRIVKYHGTWDRASVKEDSASLYIFTDNTDRDSGHLPISPNSWYSQKYGEGHHFPTMTSAVIRGLDNARPVSTQHWYHDGAKGDSGRWSDSDFEEFKSVVDTEFADIIQAWSTGNYTRVIFPAGQGNSPGDGLFNSRISAITKERTPRLYDYLQSKVSELVAIVNAEEANVDFGLTTEDFDEFSPAGANPIVTQMPMPTSDAFGFGGPVDMAALQAAAVRVSTEDEDDSSSEGKMFNIVSRDDKGNIISENLQASPNAISQARKQKTFVELNKKLREILRSKGIDVGVLTNAEARMSIGGIADFDTATVTAEGLLELIRIANGYEGEQALPEEFAHVALEMLGHSHPLVSRLLSALENSPESMQEAYDGMYEEYVKRYGDDNIDKLAIEAAGKLVAKHLFRQQRIESNPVRRLVYRVVDAIKSLFKRFSRDEIQNAIFDANDIASKIAREMLGGRLLDDMNVANISQTGEFMKVQKDLTGKEDILSKLLKTETKRLAIIKKRQGYNVSKQGSKVQAATEAQIAKLEAAIRNYKTEDAIVSYITDSLGFLAATEKSLDDAVNSGRPMNSVCKKLNTVRDTLYSFSKAIEDIREAIVDGEVQDSAGLTSVMDQVSGVLTKFYQKYKALARGYFEEMLSSVYGEHGKTVTIGKDKGRVISIKEMARKADKDISLASRWFHSIADCDDYVLKAVDDVTRNAKMLARRRAMQIRPRIETAIADLQKATGSRDQSFMFETKTKAEIVAEERAKMLADSNGLFDSEELAIESLPDVWQKETDWNKPHKTGKYISEEESKNLPAAQKKFYDVIMDIKKDADGCVPESLLEDRKIVMMRKYTMDRFKDAEGAKGKALEAWEGLKNRVMETGDNIDYDNYEVAVDFEGNRVDMLPVKFLLKGKNETYDDMSDDVATSIMAYAGMAYEYNELNNVIGILENAKYMSSERRVGQKTGSRTQRESIVTDDVTFSEPFTVRQAQTNIQKALEDFFQMHIYGHIRANEGTIGRTRISKRKVVDTINAITSYSQMAINLPQRISNVNTGLTQIIIESVGKGAFSMKDVAWATGIYTKESGDRLIQTGKTDYDNKLSLWCEYFDVHQDNGRYGDKYKRGRMSRIFNSSLLYAGLTMGEDYLSATTSLAIAHNFKVKDADGKTKSLWDAYEVKYTDKANKTGAYLSLKEGYTKEDGSAITPKDEQRFSKLVAGMNFELQGIYNLDDKSAVQQYAFGALLIMYRKWIAPALKRRYAGVSYNILKDNYQEGYYHTLFRLINDSVKDAKDKVTEGKSNLALFNIIQDMKALKSAVIINWNKLSDYEKSNLYRSFTELGVVVGLFSSCALIGKLPPPEYEDDNRGRILKWWDQSLYSQILRLRTEIGSQAPTPMFVDEALHVLRSPFAAIEPLTNAINAIQLLWIPNYATKIKSGRYRGHSKAYKYFRELPIISMFKKVDNFIDPSPLISYYKNEVML